MIPTPSEIKARLAKLEAKGIVKRTGELRDGEPVYVLTPLGEEIAKEAVAALTQGMTRQ